MIRSDFICHAKRNFHCIYFQENADCLKVIRGDLLYGIGQSSYVKNV